jgi:hypothetical protein
MKKLLRRFMPGGCIADSFKALAVAFLFVMLSGLVLIVLIVSFLIDYGTVSVSGAADLNSIEFRSTK